LHIGRSCLFRLEARRRFYTILAVGLPLASQHDFASAGPFSIVGFGVFFRAGISRDSDLRLRQARFQPALSFPDRNLGVCSAEGFYEAI
jgi:hypothetical protein